MQYAVEMIVTVPLLILLLKTAPAIRSVSQYSRAVQCQFGIVPAVYYAFDYATRVYTDLLFSGSAVVVEFMPFVCSAAYLLFLGAQALWRSRRGAPVAVQPDGRVAGGPWRTGLVSNVLNPKIAVFYTSLLPTLAPSGVPPALGMALLVLLHAVLTCAWLAGYVYLLHRARSVFERPGVRRALERVTGVVLIGFGIRVAAASN